MRQVGIDSTLLQNTGLTAAHLPLGKADMDDCVGKFALLIVLFIPNHSH